MKFPYSTIKTVFDYSVSILFLFILIPVILILIVAIKISGKGPVLFSQKRIGLAGKPFTIYKFRSMHLGTEEGIPLVCSRMDKRITVPGRFMRRYKLDEIPNFINVLKGEMSIVGPRPEQKYFIEQIVAIAPEYIRLQDVKPGITSWGQVKYGYASDVEQMVERLRYDLDYLGKRSLWFDLKIAFFTVGVVFKGKGV